VQKAPEFYFARSSLALRRMHLGSSFGDGPDYVGLICRAIRKQSPKIRKFQ
jgi:hypothetical protein